MSYMRQNISLFHVLNLSVLNFRFLSAHVPGVRAGRRLTNGVNTVIRGQSGSRSSQRLTASPATTAAAAHGVCNVHSPVPRQSPTPFRSGPGPDTPTRPASPLLPYVYLSDHALPPLTHVSPSRQLAAERSPPRVAHCSVKQTCKACTRPGTSTDPTLCVPVAHGAALVALPGCCCCGQSRRRGGAGDGRWQLKAAAAAGAEGCTLVTGRPLLAGVTSPRPGPRPSRWSDKPVPSPTTVVRPVRSGSGRVGSGRR